MTALTWDTPGERFYETGVDRGVFYQQVGANVGFAWPGLVSVSENASGGETKSIHIDDRKRYDFTENTDYQAEITAYSAPEEFYLCDGISSLATGLYVAQQPRLPFGFCYRTMKNNDLANVEFGYKLHLVYGAWSTPSDRDLKTINASPELTELKWSIDTIPQRMNGHKATAHIVVDVSTLNYMDRISLENKLYGTDFTAPYLPSQQEVYTLLTTA